VPRLCGFYPGICLTTEDKAQKHSVRGVILKHTMRYINIQMTWDRNRASTVRSRWLTVCWPQRNVLSSICHRCLHSVFEDQWLPPSLTKIKNAGGFTPISSLPCVTWCLVQRACAVLGGWSCTLTNTCLKKRATLANIFINLHILSCQTRLELVCSSPRACLERKSLNYIIVLFLRHAHADEDPIRHASGRPSTERSDTSLDLRCISHRLQ
jgi:hypothetical protein